METSIDIAEIWMKERDRYAKQQSDKQFYEDLYRELQPYYLLKGHKPFISQEMVQKDPSLHDYYKNYYKRLELRKDWLKDFFEEGCAFYDMNASCIIELADVDLTNYSKLFALQLRNHNNSDYKVLYFLNFHFFKTFEQNLGKYKSFLGFITTNFDHLLLRPAKEVICWWLLIISEFNDFQLENKVSSFPPITYPILIEPVENDTMKPEEDSDLEKLIYTPNEPIPIEGALTLEEIKHYFSFLYKDKGEGEKPFLQKEEVEEMLNDGITIPVAPKKVKFHLNCTLRYPKDLVNYFIHRFIYFYNPGKKKMILQFLGHYIDAYEGALESKSYQNLSKNITGEEPKKNLHFELNDFLPERFRK